ncbi:galactose oxidase [Atractiella rhizophila]|nr:galactose oxidase [Atractiella rhizophila]
MEREKDRIAHHLVHDNVPSFAKTNVWSHLLPHADVDGPVPSTAMYWSKAPSHGKTPTRHFRAHSGCIVDSDLWIFGGTDQKGCLKELYRMDADTFCWSRPKVKGKPPPPMRGHSATAYDKRIFIIGGGDGPSYYQDTYYFDTGLSLQVLSYYFDINRTRSIVYLIPSPRRAHTTVLHQGRIIVFGGGNGNSALNDVFALDLTDVDNLTWTELKTTGKRPVARGYHSMDLVKNKCIVFGGSDGSECFSDFHILDLETLVWSQLDVEISPLGRMPRLSHSSTLIGPYLFIFGGHDGTDYKNDVHTFNLVTLQWEPRPVCGASPSLRGYHSVVLYDSRLIVTGGFDGSRCFSDVHILDLSSYAYLPQVHIFFLDWY